MIPTIDLSLLSQGRTEELVSQVEYALGTVGFAYLINHGVQLSTDEILSQTKRLFKLPEEGKKAIARTKYIKENPNTYRGYFPISTNDVSFKEGFELGINNGESKATDLAYDLREANVWPKEEDLPGFRQFCDQLYSQCMELGHTLMRLIAISMKLPPDYFYSMFQPTLSTLRFLHYPMRVGSKEELSGPAHTDSGFVTLLFQDQVGGLEVCDEQGRWFPVEPIKDAIVVNIGDLLSKWTGGKLIATLHRVRATQASRYSIPFFFEPSYDAAIDPANLSTRTYGEYLSQKMSAWVEYGDSSHAEYLYKV